MELFEILRSTGKNQTRKKKLRWEENIECCSIRGKFNVWSKTNAGKRKSKHRRILLMITESDGSSLKLWEVSREI